MPWNDRDFRRTTDSAAEIWAHRLAAIDDADELDDAIEALLNSCHELAVETYPTLRSDEAAAERFRRVVLKALRSAAVRLAVKNETFAGQQIGGSA